MIGNACTGEVYNHSEVRQRRCHAAFTIPVRMLSLTMRESNQASQKDVSQSNYRAFLFSASARHRSAELEGHSTAAKPRHSTFAPARAQIDWRGGRAFE